MADPIADMLTRIRNAQARKHEAVYFPSSKIKTAMVRLLKHEGFIHGYKTVGTAPFEETKVFIKYDGKGAPVITGLARVSRQGRRVYSGHDEIPSVRGGLGITIVSTSRGLMTSSAAWRAKVGGEVLCQVW
jgi:small subunit ribosomal protein S8